MKLYHESSNIFTDSNLLDQYLNGGHAVVTLESPAGTKHTYVYALPKDADKFPDDIRFVYALHEEKKQFYIGMIELGRFRLTRNSRFLRDTDIVKGAVYIENMRKSQDFLSKSPMKIYHEGICARCGRQLKDDKSIQIGYGPKCKKRLKGDTMICG